MIRPVLYVDLPGIIYAIDRRARGKQHEFANFVCWLEPVEQDLPSPPILRHILPLSPTFRTWICEEHWSILGFAQVRERPSRMMWDLAYLASMVESSIPSEEVLVALLDYKLEMASTHGILGFAQVRERPSRMMWDLAYLASMVESSIPSEEVLVALLEYMLEMASTHGILRIFAKVEDEIPEMELFHRAGFQRYARELTYV